MASSAQPTKSPLKTPLVSGFATARLFHRIVAVHKFRRSRREAAARTFLTVTVSHPVGISQNPEVLEYAWVYSDLQHAEEYPVIQMEHS